jgi:hypothetical protein
MKIDDLMQAYFAIKALLESPITSPHARRQLLILCFQLENDIAELKQLDEKAA